MILWILSNSWPRQHLGPMARRRSFFELSGCRKLRTFCSACCRNTHKNMSSCWQDAYSTAVLSYNHKDHKAWQWIMPYASKVIMEQRCAPSCLRGLQAATISICHRHVSKDTHDCRHHKKALLHRCKLQRERNSKPA